MAIYMEYEGVKGDSTADGFKDMIPLTSFNFGVSRMISSPKGRNTSREAAEPSFAEVTVTTTAAKHTCKAFMEACAADLKNKVLIHFTTTTADKVAEYLLYTLTNCGVSHYSFSAGAEGIGSETMMINYDSIQIKFSSMDPGVSGTPETVGYSLPNAKKL